ncbi:hypothetical protein Airi02_031900 [Actinoallomurus iriomotensis]|uniref:Uncharacterized protein n=1 Tax=Actinoallomurus iriomotensis TaxID=478107 RepID=A0A9W6S0X1_9ACTN|nr:hypothetical protein Airi02_031900 [Actinoallomurus iriomotensis]
MPSAAGTAPGRLSRLVGVGVDVAEDEEVGGVDVLRHEHVVEHRRVRALGGERDRGAGPFRVRAHRAAAVDEQQSAAAECPHAGKGRVHASHWALDREGQRVVQVGCAGVEDRLHEVGARHGTVLQDLNGPQTLGRRRESRGERGGVEDVGGEAAGLNPVAVQCGDEAVEVFAAAGQQSDAVSGGTKAAGAGQSQTGAGADEGVGGHGEHS